MSYPPPDPYPAAGGQYPPPPQGQYPPPPQGGQAYWQESPKGKGLAITALVLGIIALLFCWTLIGGYLFGVFAIILGVIAVIRARSGRSGGAGMAITGLILGVLGLVGAVLITIVFWSFFEDSGGKDYLDCVRQAGSDQSKLDQCEHDWTDQIDNKINVTPAPR
ncbi:DUF4190 domain-containing protein [Nocardia callitridis]|uniref:DUF4190 domain-containing protein n=1 Tax=Nocardia callitridis TaxID=648753 RepID=A0ABP9K001_9NOCA